MPPPPGKKGAFRKGAASTNPDRFAAKGDTSMRTKATIQRLNMYKGGKPIRDRKGKILGGDFMSRDKAGNETITAATGRVAPDRRWFGNTRVVGASELDSFRDAMSARMHDPYAVVLNARSLPMGLLADPKATARAHLLSAESFSGTFGAKAQRKRVKLAGTASESLAALAATATSATAEYLSEDHVDRDRVDGEAGDRAAVRAPVFDKGQSRRIWGELYKVLDVSDVVVQVLDARDPAGTRSPVVERFLKEHARHKHLVFVLNKCDLVPTWVTRRWVAALSAEYPTLAFHASLTKPFGKGALIALLRQFSRLHSDKKNISVGFIGFPNVGKSSIINALSAKKVCTVAPIPGETKTWQYVTLMKRVFLVDCPGVVPPNAGDTEASIVLKGVVRHTKLEAPEEYVPDMFARLKPAHIAAVYGIAKWTDANDFLTQLATRQGRFAAGEPDVSTVARNLILDWQRGKLPYYAVPPDAGATTVVPGAKAGATPGALPAGVVMEPQVIPRLGAHELLVDEEEEGDAGQEPVTHAVGERDDGDDEVEGDGEGAAAEEGGNAGDDADAPALAPRGTGAKGDKKKAKVAADAAAALKVKKAKLAAKREKAAAAEAGSSTAAAPAAAAAGSKKRRREEEAASPADDDADAAPAPVAAAKPTKASKGAASSTKATAPVAPASDAPAAKRKKVKPAGAAPAAGGKAKSGGKGAAAAPSSGGGDGFDELEW